MGLTTIPALFYRQHDADYTRDVPAESFGGWHKAELPFDLSRTALAVMHAADCGPPDAVPGWYRAVEYLPRSNGISAAVFPPLLAAVRAYGMKVYHVAIDERLCLGHPGYARALRPGGGETDTGANTGIDLAGSTVEAADGKKRRDSAAWLNELRRFRAEEVFPGRGNAADIDRGYPHMTFYKEAEPAEGEDVVLDSRQLAALCDADGIDHLIYIGFAINWCLLMNPGGMLDMSRLGLLCSTVREAVTAVERKETARRELEKESALWRVSVAFGFVFELDDLLGVLLR